MQMMNLMLSDIIKKSGIDVSDILLVRHSKNEKNCLLHYNEGLMKEYTSVQKPSFPRQFGYIMSFVSCGGTSAVLDAVYQVNGFSQNNDVLNPEYVEKYPQNVVQGEQIFIDLEGIDIFANYTQKLVINWGKAAIAWYQKATNDKPILSLYPQKTKEFVGFENLILSFSELKDILQDEILYADWHTALKNVNAIYLITNTKNGKQYVGSAYGSNGLLGRWKCYAQTIHGGNKGIIEELKAKAEEYQNFQFSILQILSKNLLNDEIVHVETTYKNKLLTKEFGMNRN